MSSARRLAPIAALLGLAVLVTACTSSGTTATGSSGGSTSSVESVSSAAPSGAPITVGSVSTPASSGPSGSAPASAPVSSVLTSSTPTTSSSVVLPPVASVKASPAFGTSNMSPAQPLVISVAKGKITQFVLKNPDGKVVKGSVSKDGASWTLGEVLGYGKTYSASGVATGTDGKAVAIKGSFTTVQPDTRVRVNVSPGDGDVVGVAASVIVRFGVEPTDRALIEKNMTITTTPKVEGSWAWIQHDDGLWALDWRPKTYWPAGTKVHVAANAYGLKFAAGAYGADDVTTDFTIGRNQVVYADAKSYKIVVKQGCAMNDEASCTKTIATYPASFGRGDQVNDPNLVTRSGIHVVMEKLPVHLMIGSPPFNYHSTEYWDVRISDNGEFIHENPNTVGDQGNTNVSHGCINLSPTSAKAYFNSAMIGDPVEVTGTSVQLSASDGDLFDWTYSWAQWQKFSAL
ncbi:Lipoprotein-anchoring transpeptidase ErfK/SrfK [Nakamurella panacisegetis]|uniref:Lipoprotein-anchoring transpeptidase ErfK/SrfK n=1 Tax=Nakamurella panacisegetis TaxID=1090615 RepID=A0A1H0T991_9ACTN|nr:Lipoprotein-anchoring transpeptidase ErfK/SrfK [Nakamurella panacisegetis]